MELLASSPWEATLASCLSCLCFFLIQWVLGTPQIRAMQERIFSSRRKVGPDKLNTLVSGLIIRIVGFVHNTLQVGLALVVLTDKAMWRDPFHSVSPMSQFVLIVSAGFFAWDFLVCVARVREDGFPFVLHGLLCGIFYNYVILTGNLHLYGCAFLLWECSTPFTQFRWILHKMGLGESKLYVINGFLMIFSFFLCRICLGTYVTLTYFIRSSSYMGSPEARISSLLLWEFRLMSLVLNGLNYWWFSKMVRIALSLLLGKNPLKEKNIKEG
ncbi:hypothetical protein BSKO_08144 [Bryopsis sp. KO-2023]|nr:hypothetical protein BSKO_08144 [Bryopsis sp. KO-2023]